MRLFLFFTTIFSCFFLVSGQTYTGVPDDNFEQYLINEGYDTTLDNYVLTSNINDIIFIDISGQDINDLSGIEDFSALQYLTCSDNELTEIDFCYNFELLFLDCSNNPLNTLNLSHAPLLQTLVCQGSVIEELDLSQNYNLVELNIINSPIECVQVGGLYSGPSSFLNANLTMDPNGEDYFAEDCGYFSWQCSGPLFTGWVYYDEDADGIKDEDEIYLSDQIIIKDSDTDFVTASSSSEDLGRFAFYLTDGQYEVSVVPDDGWITTNTDPLAVTVIDFIPDVTDVVLGVHPIVLGHNDMSVDLTAGIQTCASVNMFYIHYENLGVISNNIEISLYLDSGLQSYSSADVAPSSIIENEVVWNINDVDVGEEGVITVAYVSSSTTTSTLASVVLTSPDVLGVMSDINMENNYDQISDEILCSLDPNDKLVSPAFGDENYVENHNIFKAIIS